MHGRRRLLPLLILLGACALDQQSEPLVSKVDAQLIVESAQNLVRVRSETHEGTAVCIGSVLSNPAFYKTFPAVRVIITSPRCAGGLEEANDELDAWTVQPLQEQGSALDLLGMRTLPLAFQAGHSGSETHLTVLLVAHDDPATRGGFPTADLPDAKQTAVTLLPAEASEGAAFGTWISAGELELAADRRRDGFDWVLRAPSTGAAPQQIGASSGSRLKDGQEGAPVFISREGQAILVGLLVGPTHHEEQRPEAATGDRLLEVTPERAAIIFNNTAAWVAQLGQR